MKKKLLALVGISSIALFAGTLFADNDAAIFKNTGTTIDKIIADAGKQNLTNVKSIEFDDGQWELKTQVNNIETKYMYNSQATPQTVKTAVAPATTSQSTQLTQVKQETENDLQPPADLTSMQNAVKAVQAKGYDVFSVEYEGKYWEVEAYDAKNLEYVIMVDADNGSIFNTKLDD
jgi:hypothetical protein